MTTDLGNLSASSRTVSIPSRAKAAAAYEPAGPPPITSTVQLCGTVMTGTIEYTSTLLFWGYRIAIKIMICY